MSLPTGIPARVAGVGLAAALLAALVGCSSTEVPQRPPTSISFPSTFIGVVNGTTQPLTAVVADTFGVIPDPILTWGATPASVATVSATGVVTGIGYGRAVVTATTSNGLSASVGVLVTAPPRIGAYTVTDLSPVPATADLLLNDSGDVLLQNAAVLYRDGVGAAIQGCVFGAALNNVSQVLCHPSGRETSASEYSLWRGGVFTPVAADTFTAARMSLGGLNDSGVVAGQVVGPVFHNTACAAQSGCLIYFLDGAPAFKSDPSSATSMFTRQLNNRRDLIFDMGTFSPNDGRIGAFQVPWSTGPVRGSSVFIRAENDQGALAIEDNELDRAHSRFYTIARIVQPEGTVTDLGDGAATGINNAGSVTGTLTALGPFLFSSGAVSLLTKAPVDQGWTVSNALKINNRGQILARASHADGRANHWILMTPVTP